MSRRLRFRHCGKVQRAIQRAIQAAGPMVTTSVVMDGHIRDGYGKRRRGIALTCRGRSELQPRGYASMSSGAQRARAGHACGG
jgi:hypothetical protein